MCLCACFLLIDKERIRFADRDILILIIARPKMEGKRNKYILSTSKTHQKEIL